MSAWVRMRWIASASVVGVAIGLAHAEGPALAGAGDSTCAGSESTLEGTDGDDELNGTSGEDVISGLGGDDVVRGLEADDLICGDAGDDVIRGLEGEDGMFGGAGHDRLIGGEDGGGGNGGAGDDTLRGEGFFAPGPGDDVVRGRGGSIYSTDPGDDLIVDRDGLGVISYENSPQAIRADLREGTVIGWGKDSVAGMEIFTGSEHNDVVFGADPNEILDGGGGFDRVNGRGGADVVSGRGVLAGGRGNDNLAGSETFDGKTTALRGGPGSDGAHYSLQVHADLSEGIARYEGSEKGRHKLDSIERLRVQAAGGGSVLIGNAGDNELSSDGGAPGNPDVFRGRGGNDVLGPGVNDFDPPAFALFGGGGEDTLRGGQGNDELFGGAGDDKIRGERFDWYEPSNDFLDGGDGADDLNGGQGTDECVNGETVENCES